MSDTNTSRDDALLARITELTTAVAKANADAKKYRLRLRDEEAAHAKLKTTHEEVAKDRDTWKTKAEQSPNEWKTRAEEYQAKLRARESHDAWKEVVGDSLRDKVTLEKLWTEIDWKPGDAPPTPEEIKEKVAAARESVPYLFNDADSTSTPDPRGSTMTTARPPLRETVEVGRGAPDKTANQVKVRRSQLQDPAWKLDARNQKMLTDAQSRGALTIIDD